MQPGELQVWLVLALGEKGKEGRKEREKGEKMVFNPRMTPLR